MSAEETLMQVRKDKHQELNGGTYPLATTDHVWSISSVVEDIGFMISNNEIRTAIVLDEAKGNGTRIVRGRLGAIRKSGALTFMKLADITGSMQLVATRNNLIDYDKIRLLDLGDIVEVAGEPVLTKTGERSLLLSSWRVLTKSHLPPPEKFVGIADPELKARKRYLDLMSSEETRARFVTRTHIIRAVRSFMEEKNFLEVETSTLSAIASGANAKPFTTHHNALDMDLRLRIAPELSLKKLLVGGLDRVYEIGRVYRNEGIDTRHNPEFTIMESYQAYGEFNDLIVFTKSLLRYVRDSLKTSLPNNVKPFFNDWDENSSFSLSHFFGIPMWDAVVHGATRAELIISSQIHPLLLLLDMKSDIPDVEVTNPNNDRLQKIDMKGMLHALSECHSYGEKMFVLFEYLAEPFLTEDYRTKDNTRSCPVFITQYPKAVSPLARAFDKSPGLCARFELFIEGRELANAFQELNDPDEQALRFQEQLESNDKDPMAFDADYVEALQYGMPPAIGFGMGIDRLVMLFTNATTIKDVILFPTLKAKE